MILAGDEIGRTQGGNNNAYCQDNETSWVNWNLNSKALAMLDFTRKTIHFRREHPVLRRRKFFQGRRLFGALKDIIWFQPNGEEMTEEVWGKAHVRAVGMVLAGNAMDEANDRGERIADDTLLIMLNANDNLLPFRVPEVGETWEVVLHTYGRYLDDSERIVKAGQDFNLENRSLVVMRRMD